MTDSTPRVPENAETLLAVATEFGTPSFVYDLDRVRERAAGLRAAFAARDVRILYAMKANACVPVLRALLNADVGVDAVSPAEAALAMFVGFAPGDVFYSANNMSEEDIRWAVGRGVVINVGEVGSLATIARLAPKSGISLRANLEVGAGHHAHVVTGGRMSKFGIMAEDLPYAVEEARALGLEVRGLHQHIGSGNLAIQPFVESVERLAAVALQVPGLRFVNIGGGLGVPYRPGERAVDLDALAAAVDPAIAGLRERGIEVWIEPGRYLVADAGTLIATVTSIKDRGDVVFAGTDSGMGHLIRPALYGAYHEVTNLSNPAGESRIYDVVGNICETGDFFARARAVQHIRVGDVLGILDAGAYAMSMASEYNMRPLPAEVVVESGEARLVRDRESPDHLAGRHFNSYAR